MLLGKQIQIALTAYEKLENHSLPEDEALEVINRAWSELGLADKFDQVTLQAHDRGVNWLGHTSDGKLLNVDSALMRLLVSLGDEADKYLNNEQSNLT